MRRTSRMRTWTLTLGWLVLSVAGGAADSTVTVWPSGPFEVCAYSEVPFEPSVSRRIVGKTIPLYDKFRTRLDVLRGISPIDTFPYSIRIAAARLTDGNRMLTLVTDPHPRETVYIFKVPGGNRGSLYDLTGVEASWDKEDGATMPVMTGWSPYLDSLYEIRWKSAGATERERRYDVLSKPGKLTLRTLLTLPKGKATLRLTSTGPIEATLAGEPAKVEGNRATVRTESTGDVADLTVTLRTGVGGKPPALVATYQGASDPAEHPLAADRLTLPWAPAPPSSAPPMAEPTFDLAGGDRARGEEVFRGDQAKCASCHKVRGQGGDVGPDLSGLVGKTRLDVFRDIYDPSATIRPDYLAYTVATRDGRVVVGTVRAEGADSIRVTDTDAKTTLIRRDEIEQLEPSPASIMPVGLVGVIGEDKTRDLLAYLTSPPPPEPARRP